MPVEIDEENNIKYVNGSRQLHRLDGPSYVSDGIVCWYREGKLHREDGPAIEDLATGYKEWWIDNMLHREDGPAIEYADGSTAYSINGGYISEEKFNEIYKLKYYAR